MDAFFKTAHELSSLGAKNIPYEYDSGKNLIYSSPATLFFNSPGAKGYGVKRAGLSIPGSVMLIVAPGCCGRNTSLISSIPGYEDRFFYLLMDEKDLVTSRHLKKIPKAIENILSFLGERRPSMVMVCITCVDALLGTDMDAVCDMASRKTGILVKPCYMYALTREGRRPPMVFVRQSIYSLLPKIKKKSTTVNLLGHFSHLNDESELYPLLRSIGVKKINEIGRISSYEEFLTMGEANFNLIVFHEARAAGNDLYERLQIPPVEIRNFYDIDSVKRQYNALEKALGSEFDKAILEEYENKARAGVKEACCANQDLTFVVGESSNADPFELSYALLKYGFKVPVIFGTPSTENHPYIERIASMSPDTRIYCNMHSTMIYYDPLLINVDITIGKDASYYHDDAFHIDWNEDVRPYGYQGIISLFDRINFYLKNPEVAS